MAYNSCSDQSPKPSHLLLESKKVTKESTKVKYALVVQEALLRVRGDDAALSDVVRNTARVADFDWNTHSKSIGGSDRDRDLTLGVSFFIVRRLCAIFWLFRKLIALLDEFDSSQEAFTVRAGAGSWDCWRNAGTWVGG